MLSFWPTLSHAQASAFVKATSTMPEATSSISVSFSGGTTAHDKLFAYFLCFGTVANCLAAPLVVADTQLNTFAAAGTFNSAATYSLFIYETTNDTPGGADTLTISAPTFILEGGASEYSGFAATGAAFDQTAGATGNDSGATSTTNFANEMLLGWGYVNSGAPTAGTSYTMQQSGSPDQILRFEDQHVTSTGAYHATFTGTMTRTMISTFKDSVQPSAFTPDEDFWMPNPPQPDTGIISVWSLIPLLLPFLRGAMGLVLYLIATLALLSLFAANYEHLRTLYHKLKLRLTRKRDRKIMKLNQLIRDRMEDEKRETETVKIRRRHRINDNNGDR